MALSSEQPLCSQCDVDVESSLETVDELASDIVDEARQQAMTRKRAIVATTFLAVGIVALVALCTPQRAFVVEGAGSIVALDAEASTSSESSGPENHVHIHYGLRKATCPDDATDKSDKASVTLDAIKEKVGAEKTDEVEFYWVYPKPGHAVEEEADEAGDWTPEQQFKTFGGYMYTWAEKKVCLALTPKGDDLSLKPLAEFPKSDIDWHVPAGESISKEYAWVCPSCDEACKHGCFAYKSKDGGHFAAYAVE